MCAVFIGCVWLQVATMAETVTELEHVAAEVEKENLKYTSLYPPHC